MRILSVAVAIAVMAFAGTASAQTAIRSGQTLSGELSTSDPKLDDGSHYDCFALEGRQGLRYGIEMLSQEIDAYLTITEDGCDGAVTHRDDDGGGGTNSIVHVDGADRTIYIRANSLSAGEAGRYHLGVTEVGANWLRARIPNIGWGSTVRGKLQRGDARDDYDHLSDCFSVSGRQGQRAVITLRSDDFDARVSLFRGGTCGGDWLGSGDDGAGGSESRMEVTLPADGGYSIMVSGGVFETGAYSLSLETVQGR